MLAVLEILIDNVLFKSLSNLFVVFGWKLRYDCPPRLKPW